MILLKITAWSEQALALENEEELANLVRDHAKSGDIVICLGAGTISAWANDLPSKLV